MNLKAVSAETIEKEIRLTREKAETLDKNHSMGWYESSVKDKVYNQIVGNEIINEEELVVQAWLWVMVSTDNFKDCVLTELYGRKGIGGRELTAERANQFFTHTSLGRTVDVLIDQVRKDYQAYENEQASKKMAESALARVQVPNWNAEKLSR